MKNPHIDDVVAGNKFRETLLPRADNFAGEGKYPLWHGWALMDAFLAGAEYARAQTPRPEVVVSDPGTEKLLRDMLDRAYKMMQMAGYRVVEQDPDSNNPIIAWMADARSVLYGGTKPHPDPENLT